MIIQSRIDYSVWKELETPQQLCDEQLARSEHAGLLRINDSFFEALFGSLRGQSGSNRFSSVFVSSVVGLQLSF